MICVAAQIPHFVHSCKEENVEGFESWAICQMIVIKKY